MNHPLLRKSGRDTMLAQWVLKEALVKKKTVLVLTAGMKDTNSLFGLMEKEVKMDMDVKILITPLEGSPRKTRGLRFDVVYITHRVEEIYDNEEISKIMDELVPILN